MVMGPTAAATATVAAQRQQRQQRQHGSSGSWMVQDDHAIKCAGMDQQRQQCQHISVQHGSSGSSLTGILAASGGSGSDLRCDLVQLIAGVPPAL